MHRLENYGRERGQLQRELQKIGLETQMTPRMERQVLGPEFDADPDKLMQLCVDAWFECSLSLDALCRARDIPYLHVLQPTLHDEGSKRMSAEEKALPLPAPEWIEGVRRGYPALRARGQELAARGVHFLDASRAFADVDATLYFDPCHFVTRGCDLLADRIADQLLSDVVRAPPTAPR
jgi:hypothetical protein